MRLIIVSIILVVLSYNCEAVRGTGAKRYLRNLEKSVTIACNKQAYNSTNNKELYDCLSVNRTSECMHLENFTEYQELKNICINNSNNCVWLGILIAVIGWMFNWDNILIQNR